MMMLWAILSQQPTSVSVFDANELCVTLWWEKNSVVWYIGYFKKTISDTEFLVEHLIRKIPNNSTFWVHGTKALDDHVES